MAEFDDLDTGTEIRFKHFFSYVEGEVAEGKVITVIQTSVGKAYKIEVEEDYISEDGLYSPLVVTPSQVIDVLNYEVIYSGENWQLLKSADSYFFDPIEAEPVPVDVSEIRDAVEVVEGESQ